jgi:hypothetical protein
MAREAVALMLDVPLESVEVTVIRVLSDDVPAGKASWVPDQRG